jgi:hypothetical protein
MGILIGRRTQPAIATDSPFARLFALHALPIKSSRGSVISEQPPDANAARTKYSDFCRIRPIEENGTTGQSVVGSRAVRNH